ncbi:hypothetical protein [Deinococcus sp.]|nr:hypothetical protein [Deinococcus sp.]
MTGLNSAVNLNSQKNGEAKAPEEPECAVVLAETSLKRDGCPG